MTINSGAWLTHYEVSSRIGAGGIGEVYLANVALSLLGYVHAVSEKRDKALAVRKGLEEKYAKQQADGLDIATVCAGLGEKDQAFAWLEKAFKIATRLWRDCGSNPTLILYKATCVMVSCFDE